MEDSGSYVDPNEASDDEDDDAEFDMGPSYKPLYAANSQTLVSTREGQLGGSDESSEPYTRRNKHPGGDKFSLSDDLKASLPKVDKAGLSALRSFVNGKGQALPFTFFEKTFPKEAQDIVLNEEEGGSWLAGGSDEGNDGSREYAFERKHLYSVMGILITAGLTKKPRIIDHWAVGAHDNYPLVRACMPRDLHPVLRPLLPLGTSHRQAQEG
ncbi:unnamed protein product [Ectocarpus sp. CCAP 1310/34]|nr:unnamed protein product [Ectocarpus sp. CCAP 1310/34]